MARVALTVQQINRTDSGLSESLATPSSTQLYIPNNDGRIWLHARNTSATVTVTVQTPGLVAGLAIADYSATISATTGDQEFGPFPVSAFNQSDASVYVDLSSMTGVTIAAKRI